MYLRDRNSLKVRKLVYILVSIRKAIYSRGQEEKRSKAVRVNSRDEHMESPARCEQSKPVGGIYS